MTLGILATAGPLSLCLLCLALQAPWSNVSSQILVHQNCWVQFPQTCGWRAWGVEKRESQFVFSCRLLSSGTAANPSILRKTPPTAVSFSSAQVHPLCQHPRRGGSGFPAHAKFLYIHPQLLPICAMLPALNSSLACRFSFQ